MGSSDTAAAISFGYSTEQEEFGAILRSFFTKEMSPRRRRALIESGSCLDEQLWTRMGRELGLPGLLVPAELGGSGSGLLEVCKMLEEAGRALVPGPLLATSAIAVPALLALERDPDVGRWLERIAELGSIVTATFCEPGAVSVTPVEQRVVSVTGELVHVLDGVSAELLIVVPVGSPAALLVEKGAAGVEALHEQSVDLTRELASVRLATVRATRVPFQAPSAVDGVWAIACVALAAEQLGAAQAVFDMTIGHLMQRRQFDRQIGSFQAMKHRAADGYVALASARVLMLMAAWAVETRAEGWRRLAAGAYSRASSALTVGALSSLQMHGAIGYTWEHDLHLFLRRAKSSELLLGSPASRYQTIAESLGLVDGSAMPLSQGTFA
jgi:alkylation response protein AidB-like acyl-CoA dehydrogenase